MEINTRDPIVLRLQAAALSGDSRCLHSIHRTTNDTLRWFSILKSPTTDGSTALHLAVQSGSEDALLEILHTLVEDRRYELVLQPDSRGNTAVHNAAVSGHAKMVKYLLAGFPSERFYSIISATNNANDSVLHIAARHKHHKTAFHILPEWFVSASGMVINLLKQTNRDGDAPLHIATTNGQLWIICDALRFLIPIQQREVLSCQNAAGDTVLHIAVTLGRTGIVSYCLSSLDTSPCKRLLELTNNQGETVPMMLRHFDQSDKETEQVIRDNLGWFSLIPKSLLINH